MRASEKRGSEGLGPGTHFTGSARGVLRDTPISECQKAGRELFCLSSSMTSGRRFTLVLQGSK